MTFTEMLNSIPCGIWLVKIETRTIVEVNSAACDLLQLTRESILGQTCRTFLCLDRAGTCPIIDHNEIMENREYLMCDAYGSCFPVLKSVIRIRYQDSDCLLESFVDLRKQKENEREHIKTGLNNLLKGDMSFLGDRPVMESVPKTIELIYEKGKDESFKALGTPQGSNPDIKCSPKAFSVPKLADKYQSCHP